MTDIGPLIRAARVSARLSQKELARHIGRTSKTVRRYEHDQTRPDIRILQRIALATGRPVEYFFGHPPAANVHSGARPPREASSDGVSPRAASREAGGASTVREEDGAASGRSGAIAPAAPQRTVPVPLVAIDGNALVPTTEERGVPRSLLARTGLSRSRASLLQTPTKPYDVRLHLADADFLMLEVFDEPMTLSALIGNGRFVDGRYVVQVGIARLQIKDLVARPDGSVSVASVNRTVQFRCRPEERTGITLHAAVVTPC
jgi:transcriptional regulator with XRE-family HTH domain